MYTLKKKKSGEAVHIKSLFMKSTVFSFYLTAMVQGLCIAWIQCFCYNQQWGGSTQQDIKAILPQADNNQHRIIISRHPDQ